MMFTSENSLLIGALLLFVAVMAGKAAHRFGAPALLFFLGVGMLFGFQFVEFRAVEVVQFVGMIALCIILFTGGMDTKYTEIRHVILPGGLLATVGVALTALLVGGFVYLISPALGFGIPFMVSLLLASTMSSTDSASVFSILRSKKQGLRENLRPLLELESGSNDPMAYMLMLLLIGFVTHDASATGIWTSVLAFVLQFTVGVLGGYLFGRLAVWTINKVNLSNNSLYPVLLLAFVFFTFAFTDLIGGNGYLAVYLAGLVIGNNKLAQRRSLMIFFDGFTWLVQIVMFLLLGLLVDLNRLLQPEVLILGSLVGVFSMFVARPLAVWMTLLPFRKFTTKARVFVSWVGLRGAVPIIFATYPLMAGVPHAELLFNVVFLVTILSLLVQGTTVSGLASLLGLGYHERQRTFGVVDLHDDLPTQFTEVEVNESMIGEGACTLSKIGLPQNTLVMMVCRDGEYFVPHGSTELAVGDKLLVVSDLHDELDAAYKDLGVDEVMKI